VSLSGVPPDDKVFALKIAKSAQLFVRNARTDRSLWISATGIAALAMARRYDQPLFVGRRLDYQMSNEALKRLLCRTASKWARSLLCHGRASRQRDGHVCCTPGFLTNSLRCRTLLLHATNSREQLQTRYIPEAPQSINVRPLERSARAVRRDLAPRKSSSSATSVNPSRITRGRSMCARWYRREFRQSAHRRDMPRTGCYRWHTAQQGLAHA
jgi:hypothetical protein